MLSAWTLVALLSSAQAPAPPASPLPAWTIEAGGFHHELTEDQGDWNGLQLWLHANAPARIRPVVEVERQTRPQGAQWRAGAGLYVDWSDRFYTFQAVSLGERVDPAARYYPTRRLDVRGFLKLPRREHLVVAGGITALTFGEPRTAQVYNAGLLVYQGQVIVQIVGYLNRTQPGSLISGAANVAVQRGAEGRGWIGAAFGAGREVYRLGDGLGAANADFTTVTVSGFGRRWFTASTGVHAQVEFQRVVDSFSRLGLLGRVFVQF